MVKELQPDLPDGAVTWNQLNIIGFPCFIAPTHVESVTKKCPESNGRQASRRKTHKKKVKTSSTQTDLQQQLAVSRPGVRYMDTTPREELFDSFSSLSSVNYTIEQQPRQEDIPHQHDEQVTNLINSLTMETTKKHLISKNTQHSDRKQRHKNKTEQFTVNKDVACHNVSLPNTTHCIMACSTSSPAPVHEPQHSSLTLTSTPSSASVIHCTQKLPHSKDTVTHHTQVQSHSRNTVTHHTQVQPHSRDTVTHHTQVEPHSRDTMTHQTQVQPHSRDIVTHCTQAQPHSRDIETHHTWVQPNITEQVKRWSKFEQLKAKYLPHPNILSENQKIRYLAKQKLN